MGSGGQRPPCGRSDRYASGCLRDRDAPIAEVSSCGARQQGRVADGVRLTVITAKSSRKPSREPANRVREVSTSAMQPRKQDNGTAPGMLTFRDPLVSCTTQNCRSWSAVFRERIPDVCYGGRRTGQFQRVKDERKHLECRVRLHAGHIRSLFVTPRGRGPSGAVS